MDVITLSTAIQGLGALLGIVVVFWGLVMRPQQQHNNSVDRQLQDHETRIRSAESIQAAHDAQIEAQGKNIDALVSELRQFMQSQLQLCQSSK